MGLCLRATPMVAYAARDAARPSAKEPTTFADYRITRGQIKGTAVVLVMGILALIAIDGLNDWVGDVGALLWISAGYFFPFVSGIAIGAAASGIQGRIGGSTVGGLVVILPIAVYLIVRDERAFTLSVPLSFIPLALAQGAIAMPVGASVRSRRSR